MPVLSQLRAKWIRRTLAAFIAIDLIAAGGVAALHSQDDSSPVTADAAVEAFRSSSTEPAAATAVGSDVTTSPSVDDGGSAEDKRSGPASDVTSTVPAAADSQPDQQTSSAEPAPDQDQQPAALPAQGVYTYATTGHESLDALGGARHDYPDETTITIRHDGCGLTERWQPLAERYDERSVCVTGRGHEIEWYESSRSFFGQTDTRRLDCDPGAVAFSPDAPVGTEYRHRCVDAETDASNVVTVLPDEEITIAGQVIRARRIRAISDVTGDSRAHSEIESWIHPETGLTLRRRSVLDGTSAGPPGDVSYHEEYVLELRSLTPRT